MKRLMMCVLFVIGFGCGEALEPAAPTDTVDVDVTDARADRVGTWKTRTTGLTMWVDTLMVADQSSVDADIATWKVRGRVSKSLSSVRAYDEMGVPYDAALTSARKFEIRLSEEEAIDLVAGGRIYLDLFAIRGEIPLYHGTVQFAPRLSGWSGSSNLYVYRAVNPIVVGSDVKFRGRASTPGGFGLDAVRASGPTSPIVTEDAPREYRIDFSKRELLAAAKSSQPLVFVGHDTASTPVEKSAFVEYRITQLGVGVEAPFEAWPRDRCSEDIRACLNTLPTADTEPCGYANEVRACENASMPLVADRYRFAADLKDRIRTSYDDAEARAHGGRTLDAAIDAVRADRVNHLDRGDVDALGFNPEHFEGFTHVDTVFPNSVRVWIGIYDHAGTLVLLNRVN